MTVRSSGMCDRWVCWTPPGQTSARPELDGVVVSTIAARLMLIAELLNKVAGSTVPGERVVAHYWQVRDWVWECGPEPPSRSSPARPNTPFSLVVDIFHCRRDLLKRCTI